MKHATYTNETLPLNIKEIALSHVINDKTGGLTLSGAICKILTIQHRFQYACLGGTPTSPICEYKVIDGSKRIQY